MLCFASTTVAARSITSLGRIAPQPYFSLPVVLGTLGGIGLLIGPVGLYWLKRRRDPAIVDAKQDGMDVSFLALLFLTSLTGLLLLVLRETTAMGRAAANPSGHGAGIVLDATLREVRARHLPVGRSGALRA